MGLLAGTAATADGSTMMGPGGTAAVPLQLAVLGDSDSESYAGTPERGGAEHSRTLQWTEVLSRLRGGQVDLGPWGSWGTPGKLAGLLRWLGLPAHGRLPRKLDYRNNFAISGAHCPALVGGESPQALQLLRLMDREPERWQHAVVVIRIGVNDFGKQASLDALARNAAAPEVLRLMDSCVQVLRQTVGMLLARYPSTRVVLVGIFDNSHWPKYLNYWRSASEQRNISAGLDYFDRQLIRMSEEDSRLAFWDDRNWFAARWGGRDALGQPAYKMVRLASGLEVGNTQGDSPQHAVVADGHAGLAWNALWAQSLVAFLNQRFGVGLAPIGDPELGAFLSSLGAGR